MSLMLAIAAGLALGWGVLVFNRLVGLRQRADSAWADVDAQLKRRYDLVPALVEAVKGYAAHERTTLEEVVDRRRRAEAADGTGARRGADESDLSGSLRRLFALAEAYPQLRASERFGMLQHQLGEIEDHLQAARRYYNAVVRDFNTSLQRFPDLLVARFGGFQSREFFELESAIEREAPAVELDA